MALAVPLADIMAYRKVGRAFFQLLEVLSHNHAPVLASTDTATFAFLVSGPCWQRRLRNLLRDAQHPVHPAPSSRQHKCAQVGSFCAQIGRDAVQMGCAAAQMSALDAGLKSLDTGVSSQCAAAVDNLAGFYFKATHPEQPSAQPSPAAQVGSGWLVWMLRA